MKQAKFSKLHNAILATFPEMAGARFRVLTDGWDSRAIEVDDHLIFKFPRTKAARAALRTEAAILEQVRPALSLPVPDLRLHSGPPLFSSHEKLQGLQIETADYAALPDPARQRLAADLARFYAELHALPLERLSSAGAGSISAWHVPNTVRKKAVPLLPRKLRPFAQDIIAAYEKLPPDPYGTVFGFFDGHGWNMAFDPAALRLNGIFDFADSGFGPLHQDFIASNYISADLTARIVSTYEDMTGRTLDRNRIDVLTGYHHLSELADFADDSDRAKHVRRDFKLWSQDARNLSPLLPEPSSGAREVNLPYSSRTA